MKKIFYVLCVVAVCFSTAYGVSFTDLVSSHWAYNYIIELASKNVINGYTDGTYRPDGTITNGEFIKLIVMASLPDWISLDDAESNLNHWAGKYVWIAERYGIIEDGYINLRNIDEAITRIEMVRIISKADLIMKGNNIDTSQKVTFSDVISLNDDDLILLKHACSCRINFGIYR